MNAAIRLLAVYLLFTALTTATSHAADPTTFTVGTFTFKRPPAWKWVAVGANSMRKAQLRVEGESGQSADVVFFTFGAGQGGGVDAKCLPLGRAVRGSRTAPRSSRSRRPPRSKARSITRVRVDSGSRSTAACPAVRPRRMSDYGLYGAILESKDGDVFVKLTGPAALVQSGSGRFRSDDPEPILAGIGALILCQRKKSAPSGF